MSFQNPLPPGIRQVTPDYASDGVTLVWGFPFRLWAAADLEVLVSANGGTLWTQLTLGVDYTVTINGVVSANVNLLVAQPRPNLIRLIGQRTPSRLTSVVNDGVIVSQAVESEFDCIEATMQELRRDANANAAALAAETARALAAEAALQNAVSSLQAIATQALAFWLTGNNGLSLPTVEPSTPGTFWNNGQALCVTPGGANALPTVEPTGHGIWWSNGGFVCITP